jgi:cell division protein FtsW
MKRTFRIADPTLFFLVLGTTLLGFFLIFDAGYAREIAAGRSFFPSDLKNQLLAFPLALLAAYLGARTNPEKWHTWSRLIWMVAFFALFLPHIPGIEAPQNGAHRWFKIPGLPPVQPAEFAKFAAILYLSGIFANRKEWVPKKTRDIFDYLDKNFAEKLRRLWPAIWVGLAAMIIEKEPDMGTAFILGVVSLALFVVGGASKKTLIIGTVVVFLGACWFTTHESYRMDRIKNHLTRWSDDNMDQTGYQTVQSELGMADGGFFGVGPGNGRAKHVLPAATTDFVMATVGEEFGILGSLCVLSLLALICFRLLTLARDAATRFGSMVLVGMATWIGVQTAMNIMMSNGLLPAIGIPLPFISYGGSSLLALWAALGVCNGVINQVPKEATESEAGRDGWRHRRPRLSRA